MITQRVNMESVHRAQEYLLNKQVQRRTRYFWCMIAALYVVAGFLAVVFR